MNADTFIELDVLQARIVADIQAAFPALQTVEFYREEADRKPFPQPACLLEMDDFEQVPEADPETGQIAVDWRMAARFILSFKTPNAKLEIRKLVASFAAFMRNRRWSHPTDPDRKLPTGVAMAITASPDDFAPELDQFEVWRVEWVQRMHFGVSVWGEDGTIIPTQVLISWVPDIGLGNEEHYIEGIPEL